MIIRYDDEFVGLLMLLGGVDDDLGIVNEPQNIVEYCKRKYKVKAILENEDI